MVRNIWTILVALAATVIFGLATTVGCLIFRNGNITTVLGSMWARTILQAAGIRIRYSGLDNRARHLPCIFIANHQSMVDIWALLPALPSGTRFVAKKSLFRIPVLGWAIAAAGFVPIDRSNLSKAVKSLEQAGARIREGNPVILFPEGTRSKDGRLRPFKKGAFHLALKAQVPIVPVTIQGSFDKLHPNSLRIRPGLVQVRFGEPLQVAGMTEADIGPLRHRTEKVISDTLEELQEPDRSRPSVTYFTRKPYPGYFSIEELFSTIREHLPDEFTASTHIARHYSRGVLTRLRIAMEAARLQGDLNHITGDIHFIAMALDPARTILTVHDCIPLTRTKGLRRRILRYFWFRMPARRSACVTVISEKTRREFLEHVSIDPSRVVVIPNCVAPEFVPGPTREPDPGSIRILQIGTTENKNLDVVCAALSGMPCTLQIIGRLTERQKVLLAEHEIRYENLYGISQEALALCYRTADIVTFVSTYEGFGMPVIEAQASGTPVITSDLSPMREIAGAGACLVDPMDAVAVREAVSRLVRDAAYRTAVIRNGLKNVEQYTPGSVAENYADIYRKVLSGTFKV